MAKKDNQKKFLDVYPKTFGNISTTCKKIGIERGTYYAWMNSDLQIDKDFRRKLEVIEPEEIFIDFCEDALTKRINAQDTTAIIFALKTKGKRRGYVERQEHELSGGVQITNLVVVPDDPDDGS